MCDVCDGVILQRGILLWLSHTTAQRCRHQDIRALATACAMARLGFEYRLPSCTDMQGFACPFVASLMRVCTQLLMCAHVCRHSLYSSGMAVRRWLGVFDLLKVDVNVQLRYAHTGVPASVELHQRWRLSPLALGFCLLSKIRIHHSLRGCEMPRSPSPLRVHVETYTPHIPVQYRVTLSCLIM
jgi:hypothetical protein